MWDDHDFGENNGDKYQSKKGIFRSHFLDFLDEPEGTPRRTENTTGIYQDYLITHGNITIHIILMDVRFDYDPLTNDRLGEA